MSLTRAAPIVVIGFGGDEKRTLSIIIDDIDIEITFRMHIECQTFRILTQMHRVPSQFDSSKYRIK
jgi:hypothetical protein